MPRAEIEPIAEFRVEALTVRVYDDRRGLGLAAAALVASAIRKAIDRTGRASLILAAAPSQDEFLEALIASRGIAWSAVRAHHMDEYLGLAPDHPASFRRYLRDRLIDRVGIGPGGFRAIPGESTKRPASVCLLYESVFGASPADVTCGGIGENGHLAFNDPPVADFLDPCRVKVVRLDEACRAQQVNDGTFARIGDVPTHAYTLTIPALLAAPLVSLCVPGPRKASAVLAALTGPISEACPASILRTHPGSVLHLDRAAASLVWTP